ncbi:MAG: protoheme IX farnesyltransferase, partial [Methylococcales bacterium]|nr:protoheme IX farnesyltransferase [Methylococcales bacterium]
YWERDIDKKMKRTANRPLATGEIKHPQWVLWAGIGLITIVTGIAAMWSLSLAFWIALGAFIYVVVYTIWLKPRTRLNIVIGGIAGSCAVLSGGAAFGAWADPAVIVLALTLFVWTPVHFWALALVHRQDYVDANYPMLPAQVPATTAARWTAFHGLLTVIGGLALSFVPTFDIWFLVPVGVASAMFLKLNWLMVRNPTPKTALPLFIFSNLYLTIILVMLLLAPIWR